MAYIEFNGRRYYVPGVFSATKVSSSTTGPLPTFHVPVIVGHAHAGHGYDAAAKSVTGETPFTFYKLCTNEAEVGAYFGVGSDIHRGAQFAFRHGLPMAYCVGFSPMVRASIIADDGGGTPVEQFTLHAKQFGPVGGWTKVKYATDTLTIRPVKRYAMLSANLGSSATRAYVTGGGIHGWLTEGATVIVGSNAVSGVSKTITRTGIEIDSTGQRKQWVELSSAVGSACNTSSYAMILQYADSTIVSPATLDDSQKLIDYLVGDGGYPRSDYLHPVKHANFNNTAVADVSSETPLKEITAWGTATAGTAPATVDSDATDFVALMEGDADTPGALEGFISAEQVVPQAYLLLDSDDTRHGTFRDWAITRRTAGYPISVTTGCAWADVAVGAGNTTAPEFRAQALNSQDVMLCASGMDREAACISRAAAVFGRRVSGGPGHNLTFDDLIYSEVEVKWSKQQLDTLTKYGVCTDTLVIGQTPRRRVQQGTSTLQASSVLWNVADSTTWSVQQRDLMDVVDRAFSEMLNESVVGADEITASVVARLMNRRAEQMEKRGWIQPLPDGYRITSIAQNASRNGWDVQDEIKLPTLTDYITTTHTVLI